MSIRYLFYIAIFSFIFSIGYSFFFSQQIVEYNHKYQTNQIKLSDLQNEYFKLEKDLVNIDSLDSTSSAELLPITRQIILK